MAAELRSRNLVMTTKSRQMTETEEVDSETEEVYSETEEVDSILFALIVVRFQKVFDFSVNIQLFRRMLYDIITVF